MPLETGRSKAALSHNIATERAAGKPEKQAVAIAFAQQRRGDAIATPEQIESAWQALQEREKKQKADLEAYYNANPEKFGSFRPHREQGESEEAFKRRVKASWGEKAGGRMPPMTSVTAQRKLRAAQVGVKPTVRRSDASAWSDLSKASPAEIREAIQSLDAEVARWRKFDPEHLKQTQEKYDRRRSALTQMLHGGKNPQLKAVRDDSLHAKLDSLLGQCQPRDDAMSLSKLLEGGEKYGKEWRKAQVEKRRESPDRNRSAHELRAMATERKLVYPPTIGGLKVISAKKKEIKAGGITGKAAVNRATVSALRQSNPEIIGPSALEAILRRKRDLAPIRAAQRQATRGDSIHAKLDALLSHCASRSDCK